MNNEYMDVICIGGPKDGWHIRVEIKPQETLIPDDINYAQHIYKPTGRYSNGLELYEWIGRITKPEQTG